MKGKIVDSRSWPYINFRTSKGNENQYELSRLGRPGLFIAWTFWSALKITWGGLLVNKINSLTLNFILSFPDGLLYKYNINFSAPHKYIICKDLHVFSWFASYCNDM